MIQMLRTIPLVYLVMFFVAASQACLFGSTLDCVFKCHCEDRPCDPTTGECSSSCKAGTPSENGVINGRFDWGGPACQVGNVALHKSASQVGTEWIHYANKATDGRLGDNGSDDDYYCAEVKAEQPGQAWWTVDLLTPHVIHNVTIFNRDNAAASQRLENFSIGVGGTSNVTEHSVCASRGSTPVSAGGSLTLSCNTHLTGRYVSYRRTGGFEPHRASLCEVVVMGHKLINADCSNCAPGVLCDSILGCRQCQAGYKPVFCNETCDAGTYGDNCASSCDGHRCVGGSSRCSPVEGGCPSDCEDWYTNATCNRYIKEPSLNKDDNVTVVPLNSSSLTIIWESDNGIEEGISQHYGYFVEYKSDSDVNFMDSADVPHVYGQAYFSTVISGLEHNTTYTVRVRVFRQNKADNIREVSPWLTSSISGTTKSKDKMNSVGDATFPTPTNDDSGVTPSNEMTKHKQDEGVDLGVIAGAAVAALAVVVILIIVAVFIVRRRKLRTEESSSKVGGYENITLVTPQEQSKGIDNPNSSKDVPDHTVDIEQAEQVINSTSKPSIQNPKPSPPVKPQKPTLKPLSPSETPSQVLPKETLADTVVAKDAQVSPVSVQLSSDTMISVAALRESIARQSVVIKVIKVKDKNGEREEEIDGFKLEFDRLHDENYASSYVGKLTENKNKNRFANIHPFDATRVVLDKEEPSDSDYINASFIAGYNNSERHYIASQGPTPKTVADFWRLVWQQNVNRVVMLTELVEKGKNKSHRYWPKDIGSSAMKTFGHYDVTLVFCEEYADYAYRKFSVCHKGKRREVHQLHFLSWKDKSCPDETFPLLDFRKRVHDLRCPPTGPLLVHCSAGVGRTGTYITLDILLQQAEATGKVDVFGCVQQLRTQRMNMVQTKHQYKFVHQAVLEGKEAGPGSFVLPCAEFSERYSTMMLSNTYSNDSPLSNQFELLKKWKQGIRVPNYSTGLDPVNVGKNRNKDILPDDEYTPLLTTHYSNGNSYINAVFTDSFKRQKATILTQMPLPTTVVDFWRLVFDEQCYCIVMLNEMDDDDKTCARYWPPDGVTSDKFGPLKVDVIHCEDNIAYTMRKFHVSKVKKILEEEPLKVCQFQLRCWPRDSPLPSQTEHLLDVMEAITKWQQQCPSDTTLVHCMNGADRAGLFAAATYVIDRMKVDQEVNVFLAARHITSRRPQAISSLENYEFLFKLAKTFMERFETYANFK